jgi:hypothetical protein
MNQTNQTTSKMLHTTGKSKAIVKNRKFPGGKEN